MPIGSPGAAPAITDIRRRKSSTVVANGPSVEKSIQSGVGQRPMTPLDGFNPTSPQNAAGIRIDPPPSVAVAIGTTPALTAAADPPLDPPGDSSKFQGLRVTPVARLAV